MGAQWRLDDGQSFVFEDDSESDVPATRSAVLLDSASAVRVHKQHFSRGWQGFASTAPESDTGVACGTIHHKSVTTAVDLTKPIAMHSSRASPAKPSGTVRNSSPTASLARQLVPSQSPGILAASSPRATSTAARAGVPKNRKQPRNRGGRKRASAPDQNADLQSRDRILTRGSPCKRLATSTPSDLKAEITLESAILRSILADKVSSGFNNRPTNFSWDQHILALRHILVNSFGNKIHSAQQKHAAIAEGATWVVQKAWPELLGFWNMTGMLNATLPVEMWRNYPCERTYRQLPPNLRPTKMQLLVPHAANIDFFPWPMMRDLLIRYQYELDFTQVLRLVTQSVVASQNSPKSGYTMHHPCSDSDSDNAIPNSLPTMPKSVRLWDLASLEKKTGSDLSPRGGGREQRTQLKSPNAQSLVRSLGVQYDVFGSHKIDDRFFEAFPCLFDPAASTLSDVHEIADLMPEAIEDPVGLTQDAVVELWSRLNLIVNGERQ